jgi:septum formation protein
VRAADAPEVADGDPAEVAVENASRKARAFALAPGDVALGVDTLVTLDGRIYGKPADAIEADAMLGALEGRTHTVVSGLAVATESGLQTAVESTAVTFRTVGDRVLAWYLSTGEWRDRAGGYAIQGAGAVLVARIEGDYLNVVGLPLARLLDLRPGVLGA